MRYFGFKLSKEYKAILDRALKKSGLSQANLARKLLKDYVEYHPQVQPLYPEPKPNPLSFLTRFVRRKNNPTTIVYIIYEVRE